MDAVEAITGESTQCGSSKKARPAHGGKVAGLPVGSTDAD
jgi:hypothetical protein